MTRVISEKVNRNSRRIWGQFKLSDKTTTKFEMVKGQSWNQWGNSTDNLYLTVERVESLCNEWLENL
jgi:hypothetical protein